MKPNCFSADPTCLDQLPYPLSSVCTSSLHADGRARIWTCLPHSSGALPCSLPLWVRLTPAGWGEEFRDPTHNPLIIPTPASCGGSEWVKQLSAAPLPGSLQLALTWAPGWPPHTCPGQICVCSDPSPSNQHTCWAHQPWFFLEATLVSPPGI